MSHRERKSSDRQFRGRGGNSAVWQFTVSELGSLYTILEAEKPQKDCAMETLWNLCWEFITQNLVSKTQNDLFWAALALHEKANTARLPDISFFKFQAFLSSSQLLICWFAALMQLSGVNDSLLLKSNINNCSKTPVPALHLLLPFPVPALYLPSFPQPPPHSPPKPPSQHAV